MARAILTGTARAPTPTPTFTLTATATIPPEVMTTTTIDYAFDPLKRSIQPRTLHYSPGAG